VNTIDGPTKLVRQDAIFGGLSIGQWQWKMKEMLSYTINKTSVLFK